MKIWEFIYYMIVLSMLLAALLGFTACRTRYVQVPTVRVDSVYNTVVQRDSVVQLDSVYIVERGGTVRETRYKYIYRDRVRVDTLISIQKDTITNVVEVEKSLTWWQGARIRLGELFMWLVPIVVLVWVAKKRLRI